MIIVTGAEICARCHAAGEPAAADMIESKTRRLEEKAVYHRSHLNHSAWAPVALCRTAEDTRYHLGLDADLCACCLRDAGHTGNDHHRYEGMAAKY
jgi:hypothetical protein